jgi:hypothetical protein
MISTSMQKMSVTFSSTGYGVPHGPQMASSHPIRYAITIVLTTNTTTHPHFSQRLRSLPTSIVHPLSDHEEKSRV